ncbi:MAG: hypothetical protein RBT76_00050 [candidate division Zixibacteria bacterium]|jgi:hypothetical protein|nr:hypothetical protein [candidate division Zixibacteria bacterium]
MKKLVTLTLCFVLLLSAASFATNTRVRSMGENNEIMLDEANIWLYPSRLYDYPDVAIGEFSYDDYFDKDAAQYYGYEPTFNQFGVHWKFGKDKPFVLGTYLYNSVGQFYDQAYLGAMFMPAGLDNMFFDYWWGGMFDEDEWGMPIAEYLFGNERISLLYSRMLGGNKFGFSFSKLHSSYRDEDADGNTSEDLSFSRYNFGFSLTEATGLWDVAAHIQMLTWKDKTYGTPPGGGDDTELDYTKPSGNMSFTLLGRYFKQMNPVVTLVPHASFVYAKFESEDYYDGGFFEDPNTAKLNLMAITVGSGMHYMPSAGMLAVLDFGLSYTKADYEYVDNQADPAVTEEYNTTITTLPYVRIGFEGEVLSWLDVRFGATSYWRNVSEEDIYDGETEDKDIYRWPDNRTYLGFAFNWGRFTVDTWTNPELFLEGLNFISGETNGMNAGMSAIYSF